MWLKSFRRKLGENSLPWTWLTVTWTLSRVTTEMWFCPRPAKVCGARNRRSPGLRKKGFDLCDPRRTLESEKKQNLTAAFEYRKISREIRKRMKVARKSWIEDECCEVYKVMVWGFNSKVYHFPKIVINRVSCTQSLDWVLKPLLQLSVGDRPEHPPRMPGYEDLQILRD